MSLVEEPPPNTACTGRGSAPRFRRHLANFGAIMAVALPVRPAGYAYRWAAPGSLAIFDLTMKVVRSR